MARHRARAPRWLWVIPALLIPLTVASAAWASHVGSEGRSVAPDVKFAGLDLSGVDQAEVVAAVDAREAEFLATTVTVDLGERQVTMTAEEIGFDYLWSETVNEVLGARHGENALSEFVAWVTTPFEEMVIPDHYEFDEEVARERLGTDEFVLSFPVEPTISNEETSYMYVVPGVDGDALDIEDAIADLAVAPITDGDVVVEPDHVVLKPTVTDQEAEDMAAALNDRTRKGVLARVGGVAGRLTSGQIRDHMVTTIADGAITATIDPEGFQREIETTLSQALGPFTDPVLEVFDGSVVLIEPGETPPICCSLDSVTEAAEYYMDSSTIVIQLEPRADDDPEIVAWADGSYVIEPVAEFTTRHPCCENRVTNIQTMADTLTGVYLIPGETISFNEFVGPRTREKGYLPAGAIRGGYMTDEVGGGVSQFVTTMFNAAFYGGLELDEYQSHSVYFSRYPYGREATLSIPGPDLVLTNTTDYPVLIWPTYDANSITVTLYSTEHIEVLELDQRIYRRGECRRSEIDRQRTYPDGRVVVDTIEANYRPGDGLDCNGNVIPRRDG